MRAPVEHASAAAGFGGSCDWPLTFRPFRDQCLYELVEPCAETTWRARGAFLRGGTNSSNPAPSAAESVSVRSRGRGPPKSPPWRRSGPGLGREKGTSWLRQDAVWPCFSDGH
jgi:hypothetical protein